MRLPVVVLLLGGVCGCTGLRRDPAFEGVAAQQQVSTRAQPGTVPSWSRPDGVPAAVGVPAADQAVPNGSPAAMNWSSTGQQIAAVRAASPYATQTAPATQPAARTSGDLYTAYADSTSSGYGSVPAPLPPRTAGPSLPPPAQAPAPLQFPVAATTAAAPLPGAPAPLAPATAPVSSPLATPVPPQGQPEKPAEQVTQIAFSSEARMEPNGSESRGAIGPQMPAILAQPAAPAAPAPPVSPASAATSAATAPPVLDLEPAYPTTPVAPIFRIVNSKRITLNFEVKDIGSSGVAAVELWSTRDMRNWKKTEAARPAANTYVIDVKEEGLYGFTMVARNGSGQGMPPHAGDVPQVWVTVDTTKPEVQLNGVELSLISKTPGLVIRWTAKDKSFNKRPITLSMAEHVDGPWTPLAAGIENTGRFEMPVNVNLPHCMYLRVEAADLAGNLGFAQTPNPIHLEMPWQTASAAPQVQLDVVRPLMPPPPPIDSSRPQVSIINVDAQ